MSSSEAESRGCTTQSGGSFRFRKPQSVRPESHRHSGAIGKPHDRPRGPLQDYGARDLGGHDAVPSSTANGRASRGALYERARCLHGRELNQTEAEEPLQPPNPWTLHQDLKKGQAILISQAWDQHVADRKKVSTTSRKLLDVMEAEWQDEMQKAQNEVMLVVHGISQSADLRDLHLFQKRHGRSSAQRSRSWNSDVFGKWMDLAAFDARFDQCRPGLTDVHGVPHKKATSISTFGEEIALALDGLRSLPR